MNLSLFDQVKQIFESYSPPEHPIFLENITKDLIPNTSAEFLVQIITEYNQNNNTVFVANGETKVLTGLNHSRSVSEIFYLTKYYFPDYTLKQYFADIYESIYQINIKNVGVFKSIEDESPQVISMLFCSKIGKPVFWGTGLSYSSYVMYCRRIIEKSIELGSWYMKPLSKYFPIVFIWMNCSNFKFWPYFMEEEFIREIVGDKYLFLNDLNNNCIVKNLP